MVLSLGPYAYFENIQVFRGWNQFHIRRISLQKKAEIMVKRNSKEQPAPFCNRCIVLYHEKGWFLSEITIRLE
jgi:hypothetical protein